MMNRYIKYFIGVLKHKYYVFLGCRIMKVGLWQSLIHDLSKFLPVEFFPYARTFYDENGNKRDLRRQDGGYDPNNSKDVTEFSHAWINHQRNKHHWQAWISIGDSGNLKAVEIPEKYVREMIADWVGAGLSYSGTKNPIRWYETNKDTIILHEKSRKLLEKLLYENFDM